MWQALQRAQIELDYTGGMEQITVLATSAGNDGFPSVFAELKGSSEVDFRIVAVDVRGEAVGLQLADAAYLVPTRAHAEELMLALREIVEREQVDVLLPLSTLDQPFFSERRTEIESWGISLAVNSVRALQLANNKHNLLQECSAIGVANPRYETVTEYAQLAPALQALGYPECSVVFKVNEGTGAQGVKIIDPQLSSFDRFMDRDNMKIRVEDLHAGLEHSDVFPASHLVEYLPGDEFSVDVFADRGEALSVVVRKRLAALYGLATHAVVVEREDIVSAAVKITRHLGLSYVNNLQFRDDAQGNPKIMEINPRIPGTIGLTAEAGV